MAKRGLDDWIHQPKVNQILFSFLVPKTPRRVEKELGIKKLKMKPFLEKGLLESLNPRARKGRLYRLTRKTRGLLKLPVSKNVGAQNWLLIGWVTASPKQRVVLLKVIDSVKRTSEELRLRASQYNPHLTRISTKENLNGLVDKGLTETEIVNRKRYYWISEMGRLLVLHLH